jgi:16S rRNA (cytosine1402-N4)-methyltransferase
MHQNQDGPLHLPVLLESVITVLAPKKGESYLDLTAGYGGHANAILSLTKAPKKALLVDRDKSAIDSLKDRFSKEGVKIIQNDFYSASQELLVQAKQYDMILADLGVSSMHLNIASRGFSFNQNGPLDMRMDQGQKLTAETIVNNFSEAELADLIKRYGEDPKAAKIANLIVHNRPILTTHELAKIVAKAWPGHFKIHPATRTFQALRIAVNDELEQLKLGLPIWVAMLRPGGRLAVISFHSLEDRQVKHFFQEAAGNTYDAELKLITKHPVTSDKTEIAFNPRARSAKLRAAAKINNGKGSAHAYSG